ncbi:ABC transporter substrate-binding protein [Ferdinandcohnia sp. SAFN-114]|uniref:ABC transporter substrate-binding protein n=1 Tax=Ferdinandcohnia sp. SAFN-114 TaxID=3387275 RepID=UPI003F80E2D5
MFKKMVMFLLTLGLAFALIGCSGETSSDTDSESESEGEGGAKELIVATGADPTSLDPRKTWSGPGYSINSHVFEPLVFRKIVDGKVSIEGVLAESYENVDELTWKFTLKEGVKFHNGAPLNAEAVKFTLESIQDPDFNTSMKIWLNDIAEITTEGDLTVIIKTKTPTRGLLSSLTQVPIVEPGAVEELGAEFNVKPVGTGPYEIVEYIANNNVKLKRFDGYWGEPGVSDSIEFRIMPENAVRLAALQRGDVHIAENISADKIEEVKQDENLDIFITETLRVNMMVANFKNEWMAKKDFREAISLAIDRESLVNNILSGNTIPASSVSPPGTIGFNEDLPVYPFDPEKAKELLEKVGYDGSPIKMGAPVGRYAMDRQMGEAIAGMLQNVGINVELETLEFSSYVPKMDEGAYDFYYIGVADLTINPNTHWNGYYHSENAEGGYANPEVDKLMDQAIQTIDDAEVTELYKEIQEILYEEKPTFPLYNEPHMVGVRKGVQGFEPRLDEYVIVRDAYFEE